MDYEQIITDVSGRVGLITMNRPDKLNAMTGQMDHEIRQQIAAWNADDAIGAIVWTGAGRGFCSGADISDFEATVQGTRTDDRPHPAEESWIEMIKRSKPLIAAINGVAVGEGLTRTLPCDVRIAAEGARLSFRFVRIGLTPEFAGTHYAVYLIGLGRALELMLTGEMIEAEEAYRIGLVNHVYPADQMLDKAMEMATEIADNPRWHLAQIKRLIHRGYIEHDIDDLLADEGKTFGTSQQTEAHREALTAFRERRPPRFH